MSIINKIRGGILGGGGGGTDTSDATATAADILTGKTAYGSAGTKLTGTLNTYTPPMMQFDGSTGYYGITGLSEAVSAFTLSIRFSRDSFTGDTFENMAVYGGASATLVTCIVISADHSTLPNRRGKAQLSVRNSSNVEIAKIISNVTVLDGDDHELFFSYNPATAALTFTIDGVAADDTGNPDRVAPTTGTLDTLTVAGIGASSVGADKFSGKIGATGFRAAYLTNADDFGTGAAQADIDESGWTEWGAQPLFWNEYGFMENNKGSAGDMTKNGAIDIADF